MKRLLAPILTIAVLAFTATAAAQDCRLATRLGSAYTTSSVTGSCGVVKTLTTANLSCGAGSGSAVVRYGFSLPTGCGPSATAHVDWTGAKPGVAVKTIGSSVRVAVRLNAPSKSTVISMVSISYLC